MEVLVADDELRLRRRQLAQRADSLLEQLALERTPRRLPALGSSRAQRDAVTSIGVNTWSCGAGRDASFRSTPAAAA